MAIELAPGDPAPDFMLPLDDGRSVSARDFRGRKLVLFFFPRADTSGCTKEARAFSGLRAALAEAGTEVLGVSADPVRAQQAFKVKYGLELSLASDEAREALAAYGVWVEKSMYGRRYMGIERATFLLGADGRIARIWRKVKVPGHAEAVLAAAAAL